MTDTAVVQTLESELGADVSEIVAALISRRQHAALNGTMRTTNDENGDVTVERWAMSLRAMARLHPTWINRPYAIWRAEEHAYWNADAWARMIREHPLGNRDQHSRTWDWTSTMNGGRVQLRPSTLMCVDSVTLAPRWRFRDVGANDDQGGLRHPPAKRTIPHGACHITFPDWAPMLDATPSTRASVPVIHRDEHVNAPSSPIKRAQCKCGVTHHG